MSGRDLCVDSRSSNSCTRSCVRRYGLWGVGGFNDDDDDDSNDEENKTDHVEDVPQDGLRPGRVRYNVPIRTRGLH